MSLGPAEVAAAEAAAVADAEHSADSMVESCSVRRVGSREDSSNPVIVDGLYLPPQNDPAMFLHEMGH